MRFGMHGDHLAFEAFGQPHGLGDVVLGGLGQTLVMRRAHIERDPGNALALRHAPGGAHQPLRDGRLVQADQQPVLRRPGPGDGVGAHVVDHLRVDSLGGDAHRQLAQRGQIALAEEMRDRAARLIGHVDLALAKTLDELVRRQIDQLDLVGELEDLVGQRFADLHAARCARPRR